MGCRTKTVGAYYIAGYTDREDLETFILSKTGGERGGGGVDPRPDPPPPGHAPGDWTVMKLTNTIRVDGKLTKLPLIC